MKKRVVTWLLALCAGTAAFAQPMSDGHVLTDLWKQYQAAQKADRPQLEADILAQIKEEAIQKHLPVDFYDAATAYVTTVQRRDWKQRDKLREDLAAEVKAFDDPMVTFHWMNQWDRVSTDALWAYVQAHPDGFQGHNPAFYRDVSNYLGGTLTPFISTDKEYVLWRVLKDRYYVRIQDDEMYQSLLPLVQGRYPNEAALQYFVIGKNYRGDSERENRRKALQEMADAYAGKAVSLYPRADLLSLRKEDLDLAKAPGTDYEALCADARKLEKERKAYKGDEATVAEGCTYPANLVKTLTASDIDVNFEGKNIRVVFQNLKQATVTLRSEKKTVKTWKATNPVGSFYVEDTLLLAMPELPDGDYNVEAVSGKLSDSDAYSQYTLSIATRTDSRGVCVYVADYQSGEPLSKATLRLTKDQKELASGSVRLDGFTPLPAAFVQQIKKTDAYLKLEAVSGDRRSRTVGIRDGLSDYHYSDDRTRCVIYKDQGAYRPGDILRFKAVVFRGDPALQLEACTDKELEVRLLDSEGNVLETKKLTTNEFGALSGQFTLPMGLRNGRFRLEVGDLAYDYFRVDEFTLPSFELSWDPVQELYLVGDDVPVSGRLESYSGHPLSGARISAKVLLYERVMLEQEVPVEADNSFHFTFPAQETGYYNVELNVTDATGETLSFNDGRFIGEYLSVKAGVSNSAEVDLTSAGDIEKNYWMRYQPRFTVLGTEVELKLDACDGEGNPVPLPVRYRLLGADDQELASGETPSGVPVKLSLPGAGYYRVLAQTSARRGEKEVKADEEVRLFCILPESKRLMPQAARVFIPGPLTVAEGAPIRARVGSSEGTAHLQVLLYGEKGEVLEIKKLKVLNGKLEDLSFEYKASYPDAVRLQVFYFLNGKAVSYDWQYRREKDRYTLPLQFTRFHDKAYPHTEYAFTLKTAPDAEVLLAAWDKSLDAISHNGWSRIYTWEFSVDRLYVSNVCGSVGSGYGRGPVVYGARMMSKSTGAVLEEAAPMMMNVAVEEEAAEYASADDMSLADVKELDQVTVRSEFASALTFQPHLRPLPDGTLEVRFSTSDKLSTYYVRAFAHDRKMRSALTEQEMVVSLPVKVSLLEPRFLYEGDVYEAAVTVSSVVDEPVSGVVALQVGSTTQQIPVTVEPHATVTKVFKVTCHSEERSDEESVGANSLTLKAIFKAADFSDAVQVTVPVYPAAQVLTEAHSAVLHHDGDREALLAELRSRFVNIPGAEAQLREISVLDMVREAIPAHVEPTGKDVLSLSEAWYIRLMASRLGVTCHSEERSDEESSDAELLDKILSCRNADGGFAWFEGMSSSPSITAVMLERFAKLRDRGFDVPDVTSSVKYLDKNHFDEDYPYWRGGISDAQYLHIRSLYPMVPFSVKPVSATQKESWKNFQKWVKDYLVPSKKDGRGLQGQILAKGRRLLTLRNLLERDGGVALAKAWGVNFGTKARLEASRKADVRSLVEYAVEHRDGGWYYPNAVLPWRGLMESEAYAHSLLCDLLSSCHSEERSDEESPAAVADGIRLWLMLQKETQHWDTEPAYIDAITSILDGSEAVLDTRVLALSATYEAPFQKIKASGNGFKIERKFYKEVTRERLYDDKTGPNDNVAVLEEIKPGDPVSLGDKILVKYSIWNAENRSFVKLTAGREASLQPVQQLSGHLGYAFLRPFGRDRWSFVPQGYRNVKASCTEFYFDSYPEEKSEMSEEFYIQQAGRFQAPVVVIESLYARHYRANSAYRPALEVKVCESK